MGVIGYPAAQSVLSARGVRYYFDDPVTIPAGQTLLCPHRVNGVDIPPVWDEITDPFNLFQASPPNFLLSSGLWMLNYYLETEDYVNPNEVTIYGTCEFPDAFATYFLPAWNSTDPTKAYFCSGASSYLIPDHVNPGKFRVTVDNFSAVPVVVATTMVIARAR